MKVKNLRFRIYNIQNLSSNNEFKKVTNKYLVRKVKVKNKDCPKKLNLYSRSHACYHDSFFYITSSNAHKIYKVHYKSPKLDTIFGEKGYFYSDSLVQNIKTKEDYDYFPSEYMGLYVDTVNSKIYRTYKVGLTDTTVTKDLKYSKMRFFMQIYDLNSLKFLGEIPLKGFNDYYFPNYFYSQVNKVYFWCPSMTSDNYLFYSLKLPD
jgi:hypothetical protein